MKKQDRLFFQTLKEKRNNYFAVYIPAGVGDRFASLQLVFPNAIEKELVPSLMENELRYWLARYDIPTMVPAFNESGTGIHIEPVKSSNYLMGMNSGGNNVLCIWGPISNDGVPTNGLDKNYLKRIYVDIPYKTNTELEHDVRSEIRQRKIGWLIVVAWALVPIVVAVLGMANLWIGIVAGIYAIIKAGIKALKLIGSLKPSSKDIAQQEKERKMAHYYYHCERNPKTFNRLKLENFEMDLREDTRSEWEAFGQKQDNHGKLSDSHGG
jgi:hypothetical protein